MYLVGVSMRKKKYYVVFRGRRPGIYTTWEECHSQVTRFQNNLYRGFETMKEAHAALAAFRGEDVPRTELRGHQLPL